MGHPQEPAGHELRQAEPFYPPVLQEGHHPEARHLPTPRLPVRAPHLRAAGQALGLKLTLARPPSCPPLPLPDPELRETAISWRRSLRSWRGRPSASRGVNELSGARGTPGWSASSSGLTAHMPSSLEDGRRQGLSSVFMAPRGRPSLHPSL